MPDQILVQNTSTPTLYFPMGDAETSFGSLIVTATSSNPALIPNEPPQFALGGVNCQRTLVVKPLDNQTGRAAITLSVSDGANLTSTSFVVDVISAGRPPTLTGLAGRQIVAPGRTPDERASPWMMPGRQPTASF
ncbi:MAG: hypothetical protein PHC88_05875 [Terrimicrobiaceae bacterium]|nr:hypothetical protein [Terrimicrobiaceae bacterium]